MGIIENKCGSPADSKHLLIGRMPADIFHLTFFFNFGSVFRSVLTLMHTTEEVLLKW